MAELSNNTILFIGLANEYCQTLENATSLEKEELIDKMLKLLPRLYIAISDFSPEETDGSVYIDAFLDEIYYDSIRRNLEMTIGEEDTFLEVFEEDMKFSDTPIAVSASEYLADIFQYLFDFIHAVKEASEDQINNCMYLCKENFEAYWGQTLCNVLRALHRIKYNSLS